MRDPLPAPDILVRSTQPLARALSLRTLPFHTHEILPSFCFYTFLDNFIAPRFSAKFFPQTYSGLSEKTKRNWNVHVVSLVQSCFISTAALLVICLDKERSSMGSTDRIWGSTGATGMVQGFSTGYFLWDVVISSTNLDIHGPDALAHATSALAVSLLGFRPFCNYYGLNFVIYELSTPFLNIHWFMDKLGLTGSWAQMINGLALVLSFGCSRLLWGTYQSVKMYQDIWAASKTPGGLPVPPWLAVVYVLSNTTLSCLNFYWFGKMIHALRKRFDKSEANRARKSS